MSLTRWLYAERLPIAVTVVLTIALMAWFTGPLSPDISGQFWLARAMRNGARLYVDIVEINPPLWFWMAVPIDWLAQTIGVRTQPLTIGAIGGLVIATILASARLITDHGRKLGSNLLTYVAALLLIMPMQHLGQREHLALIGSVPYLFLAARRRQGESAHSLLAAAIGVGAALGFALKPYFLAVPVLIELWLLVMLRREWRPIRSETLAVGMVGASYAIAVLVVSPDYMTNTLPLIAIYNAAAPPLLQSLDALPIIWLCMIAGLSLNWRAVVSGKTPITASFLVGFAGFAFSHFIQHKGWFYHGLPATGCLAIAIAASLVEAGIPATKVRAILPALLIWPFAFPIVKTEMAIGANNDIGPALSELRSGDTFGLVSTLGITTWPSAVDRGLRSSGRYGQYFMLPALDAHPTDPTIRTAAEQAVRLTALDYRCLPPTVIVFTRFDRRVQVESTVDDPYRYFVRFPEFRAVLGHYRLWKSYGMFDVYRQVAALAPVAQSSCRRPG